MGKAFFTLFLLLGLGVYSQEKPITVEVYKESNELIFEATNTSNTSQEMTLSLTEKKGLRGYTRPIKKIIEAKSTIIVASLTITGAYSYKYKTSYKASPTRTEQQQKTTQLSEHSLKDLDEINSGIVVFDKTDCPRCQRSTAFLVDNNIDFKLLNITDNTEYRNLMWSLLRKDGLKGKVTTPVILVNGKISYSHRDLEGFLKSLK